MKKYLLIISCSGSKRKTPELIPANQRYTGTNYKVIHKAIREGYFPKDSLDIVIISAKLGFLEWDDEIENYEQEMTKQQAKALRSSIQEDLKSFLDDKDYDKVLINLGATYNLTLEGFDWNKYFSEHIEARGRIGEKLSQLKAWLIDLHRKSL